MKKRAPFVFCLLCAANFNLAAIEPTLEAQQNATKPDTSSNKTSNVDVNTLSSCQNVFNQIESMNQKFSQYTEEPLIRKNLEERLASIKRLLESLPVQNKKETCDNILVQIESLRPGVQELEKAMFQE